MFLFFACVLLLCRSLLKLRDFYVFVFACFSRSHTLWGKWACLLCGCVIFYVGFCFHEGDFLFFFHLFGFACFTFVSIPLFYFFFVYVMLTMKDRENVSVCVFVFVWLFIC